MTSDPSSDDAPITLAEAASGFFNNKLTPASLRAESRRGSLKIYRIGRQEFTTIADLNACFSKDVKTPQGIVYFATTWEQENFPIKIGTTVSQGARFRALQNALPWRLEVLTTIDGGVKKEAELHRRFSNFRLEGEWFERHKDLMDYIASVTHASALRAKHRYGS